MEILDFNGCVVCIGQQSIGEALSNLSITTRGHLYGTCQKFMVHDSFSFNFSMFCSFSLFVIHRDTGVTETLV